MPCFKWHRCAGWCVDQPLLGRIAAASVADLGRTAGIDAGSAVIPIAGKVDAKTSTVGQPGLAGQGAGTTTADLPWITDMTARAAVVGVGVEVAANAGAVG